MNWLKLIAQTDLSWILSDPNEDSRVGKESGSLVNNGISVYRDSYGSCRYVFYKDGEALAGIQVVSNKEDSVVANIYTKPPYRRSGLATKLFRRAKQDFPNLQHSNHLTDDGDLWNSSL